MAKEKKKCKKCSKELSLLDTCKLDGEVYCEKCFKIVKGEKKGKAKTKAEPKEPKEVKDDEQSEEKAKKKTKPAKLPKPTKNSKAKSKKKITKINLKWISAILYIAALYLIYMSIVKTDIVNLDFKISENIGIATKGIAMLLEGVVLIVIASMVYIMGNINEQLKKNQEIITKQLKEILASGSNVAQSNISSEDLDAMLKKELDSLELENIEIKPGQEDFIIDESEELDFDLEEDFSEEEIIIIDEDDERF